MENLKSSPGVRMIATGNESDISPYISPASNFYRESECVKYMV